MGWAEKNKQWQEKHMRGFLSSFCKETFDKIADESEPVESFTKSFNALCACAKAHAIMFGKDPREVMLELLLEVFEECESGKVDPEDPDGVCGTNQMPKAKN